MELIDIFKSLDKNSIKWSTYFPIYEKHFSKFVGKSPKILEIGVLGGGSIELWCKYFGEGTSVIGIDINGDCLSYKYDGDYKIVIGDQGDVNFWQSFLSDNTDFDIIIDDGGHTMLQQIITLNKTFPHLKNGGVFLCEDTHTSYWSDWGGGINNKTFTNYSKILTDLINKDHFREKVLEDDIIENFKDMYSVSFYNSVVVFEKQKQEEFICLSPDRYRDQQCQKK
jgi:hypothetical protein